MRAWRADSPRRSTSAWCRRPTSARSACPRSWAIRSHALQEPLPGTAPFAVISHEYWQRRFGGHADALGRPIALSDGVLSVIGVMPASFFGETVGERPDAWVPLAMQTTVLPGRDWLHDQPGNVEKVMWLHLFARLRPDVSRERAQAHVNVVFQQGLAAYYGSMADAETRKRFLDQRLRLRDAATGASSLRGDFAEPLFVLLAAAGLVLLIACSNLGQPPAGADHGAQPRDGGAAGAWRQPRAADPSAVDGKPVPRGGRWRRRTWRRPSCCAKACCAWFPTTAIALPAALDLRVLGFVFVLTLAAGLILGLLPAHAHHEDTAGDGVARAG